MKIIKKIVTYPVNKTKDAIQLARIYNRAQILLDLLQEATVQHERNPMSKSLFKSKTFWFNIVTATLQLSQVLPLPVEYTALIVGVGNIALRFVTETPVHVTEPVK